MNKKQHDLIESFLEIVIENIQEWITKVSIKAPKEVINDAQIAYKYNDLWLTTTGRGK